MFTSTLVINLYAFSIELIPYIDDSGPTLCINTDSDSSAEMILSLLANTARSKLPRMTPTQMQNTGFINGKFSVFSNHRTHHCQILC